MLARWPDRIVTEISPHAGLAGTFGRALRFWHEVALTTCYLAGGPYAVTDTAGLAERHAVDLEDLAALGCPVDSILFPELIEGEAKLGPEEPVDEQQVSPAFSLYSLTRRPGFEIFVTSSPGIAVRGLSATSTPTSSPDGTASFERQPAIMPRPSPPRGSRQRQSNSPALRSQPRTIGWVGTSAPSMRLSVRNRPSIQSGFLSCRWTAPGSLIEYSTPWADDTLSARSSSRIVMRDSHRRPSRIGTTSPCGWLRKACPSSNSRKRWAEHPNSRSSGHRRSQVTPT